MGKAKRSSNPIVLKRIKDNLKEKSKLSKQLLKQKRARLVAKNLPFKATEDSVKAHFEQYGSVESVELLKKPDGKLLGCAFVQFNLVQHAAKARHYANNAPFLGRNLTVDFAKPKNKYKKQENSVKLGDVEVKDEPIEIKDEPLEIEAKDEKETDSESEEAASEQSEHENDKDEAFSSSDVKKQRFSHDVSEGKTIFVKNVPFESTNDDLKACMLQYGPIYYALVCVDKLTEHSKGTAFVKFVNKEDAEKALNAGTELTLLGNVLDCHKAVDRNELQKKFEAQKEEKNKPRDSRNLYLVKEGVILAGSKAAEGVSATDMAKRLQLEQYKTQMLRKLNTFVSRDRLVVHNLPQTWDDNKLRTLLQKYSTKGALIKEARVMRDMRRVNANGIGVSKEYGFVKFSKHEDALAALRALNNNPNIFSAQKRPIVAFSIENKSAIKAKLKRLEKSKLKNPKAKNYDPAVAKKEETKKTEEETTDQRESYVGVTSEEGKVHKMRSRHKLSLQAKLHHENIKKAKKKQKAAKKTLEQKKKDFIKQDKQKINKKNKDDGFSRLVDDYKRKIMGVPDGKKTKWYDS